MSDRPSLKPEREDEERATDPEPTEQSPAQVAEKRAREKEESGDESVI
ncbi:MAG TPA: hypothetical protein VFC51_07695 [Chloroflexota bacterium]|nr:hypothetical protein [Chloroflexota bacterium]